MKRILAILLLICLGCIQEEPKPKIEIYLLKEKIESYEGVPILEADDLKNRHESIRREGLEESRWDTVTQQLIFAGEFNAKFDQLQKKPLILDSEVYKFHMKKNALIFDSLVNERIRNLKPRRRTGVQFALTVDHKIVLTGYWWSRYSSYYCNTHHIYTVPNYKFPPEGQYPSINDEAVYFIDHGSYWPQHKKKVRPPYPPELIEAFRSSGRLIE